MKQLISLAFLAGMASGQVTFSKEISRIIQDRCQTCHRQGDIAPFVLDTFESVVFHSREIETALKNHEMPPWKPKDGFGEFKTTIKMPDEERQMVLDWIAADMPQGDPADLPAPKPDTGDWPAGPPDLQLSMINTYTAPAGHDTYRCFIIPTGLTESQNLAAVDVLPGARQVVHHVLLFQDRDGTTASLDGKDGQPGYDCFGGPGIMVGGNIFDALTTALAGWAPGQRPNMLPDGLGIPLKKGAKIIMQVHYHPRDGSDVDQTRVGLYFTKAPVTQHLFMLPALNDQFTIPAGEEKYEVKASLAIPPLLDLHVVWVYPHMHLLGREIKVDVLNRDQTVTPLIWEDDWDFHWQGAYTLKEFVAVPAGSVGRLTCTFDNSPGNHHNPNDPPKAVSWGEQTTDEMCLAFMGVTFDNEKILSFLIPGF